MYVFMNLSMRMSVSLYVSVCLCFIVCRHVFSVSMNVCLYVCLCLCVCVLIGHSGWKCCQACSLMPWLCSLTVPPCKSLPRRGQASCLLRIGRLPGPAFFTPPLGPPGPGACAALPSTAACSQASRGRLAALDGAPPGVSGSPVPRRSAPLARL